MRVLNKLKSKKGGLATIVAYMIVFLPLLYIILIGFFAQIRDNTEDFIHATLRNAVDITTKRGVFDEDIKNFIVSKIGGNSGTGLFLPEDYEIVIGKQDEGNIGGGNSTIIKININDISSSNKVYFKVGDVVYIQFKIINPDKEPIVSRLIRFISRDNSFEYDMLLIVQQGMVEVNGE